MEPTQKPSPLRASIALVVVLFLGRSALLFPGIPANPILMGFVMLAGMTVALLSFGIGLHCGPRLTHRHRVVFYVVIVVLAVLAVVVAEVGARRLHDMMRHDVGV